MVHKVLPSPTAGADPNRWYGVDHNKLINHLQGTASTDPFTLHVDVHTFKHSTTNLAGDLLVNDGTRFSRFARGSGDQYLKMNSGGTGLVWGALTTPGGSGVQAGGSTTKSGNASTTTFTIAHGLTPTPEFWFVHPTTTDARGDYTTTIDATNITITYPAAPATGTDNLGYVWGAGYVNAIGDTGGDEVIVREAGVQVGAAPRKLNFVNASEFDLSADTTNDEIDIAIAASGVTNTHLAGSIANAKLLQITDKAKLHSSILYNDVDNSLGAHYLDIGEIGAPAAPAADIGRLFFDSSDEHIKIKKSGGSVVDLEGGGGGGSGLQKGGTAQFNGTGSQTVFTIAHELTVTPDFVSVDAASTDAQGEFVVTKDATDITITYAIAPPSGTNNVKFEWGAGSTNAAVQGFTATTLNTLENKTYQNALFNTYADFIEQASAPADPAANRSRIYMKEIDPNNEGLFAKVKKNGAFVEVMIY